MTLPLFDLADYTCPPLTKQDQLQAMWDATGSLFDGVIEFRGRRGWWALPNESRYFNDEGECLGKDFKSASRTIEWLTGRAR